MIRSRVHSGAANAPLPTRRAAPTSPPGPPAAVEPSAPDRKFNALSSIAWAVIGVATLAGALYALRSVLFILGAALVFAWLLDRPVSGLTARGASRGFAIFLVFAGLFAALLVLVFGVIPGTVHQLGELSANLTPYLDNLSTHVGPWVATLERQLHVDIPLDLQELGKLAPQYLQELSPDYRSKLQEWAKAVASGGFSLVISALSLSLLPLFTFFILRDFPWLVSSVDGLVPLRARPVVRRLATEIDARLAGWVRGQLTVAVVLGGVYSLGLWLSGIDLAITVGLMGGALFLVPYLGPAGTAVLAITLDLLKFGFDWHLGAVVATFAIGQGLEGTVLTPLLVGDRVGLHPMVVMVAIIVGGNLFGILGIVVAVPTTAALAVIAGYLLNRWRESRTFQG